jgi:hypothetical protein
MVGWEGWRVGESVIEACGFVARKWWCVISKTDSE